MLRGAFKKNVRPPYVLSKLGILDELILKTIMAERGGSAAFNYEQDATICSSQAGWLGCRAVPVKVQLVSSDPPPFALMLPPSAFQCMDLQNISNHRGSRMTAVGHFARPTRADLQVVCKPKPNPSRATCKTCLVTAEFPILLKRLKDHFSEKLEGFSIDQLQHERPTRNTTELGRPDACLRDRATEVIQS